MQKNCSMHLLLQDGTTVILYNWAVLKSLKLIQNAAARALAGEIMLL